MCDKDLTRDYESILVVPDLTSTNLQGAIWPFLKQFDRKMIWPIGHFWSFLDLEG